MLQICNIVLSSNGSDQVYSLETLGSIASIAACVAGIFQLFFPSLLRLGFLCLRYRLAILSGFLLPSIFLLLPVPMYCKLPIIGVVGLVGLMCLFWGKIARALFIEMQKQGLEKLNAANSEFIRDLYVDCLLNLILRGDKR